MHASLITEAEISAIVLAIGWILKMVLKPSRVEITLILNILIFLTSGIFAFIKKWEKGHMTHIESIKGDLRLLKKNVLEKKKIKG